MREILFAKLREGAVIPSRRDEDSDYDLYACFEEEEFVIPAFSTRLIPTGLISAFDESLGVKFEERGSNTKWCGIVQAGVIDSGYRGEWLCAMYNGNPVPVHISKAVQEVERREDRVLVPYTKAICRNRPNNWKSETGRRIRSRFSFFPDAAIWPPASS